MLKFEKRAKILKIAVCLFVAATAIFLLSNSALAAAVNPGLDKVTGTGLGTTDPRIMAANIIRVALGFLGILAVSLIIYAGWLWMTSEGNEEKIEKAKNILKNAVIGLIIVLAAFGIASFILSSLLGATGGGGPFGGGPGDWTGFGASGGAVVDYTFPANGQINVPRNLYQASAVLNEPIDSSTFTSDNADIQVYTIEPTSINRDDRNNQVAWFNTASPLGRLLERSHILALGKDIIKIIKGDKAMAADASPVVGTKVEFNPEVINEGKTLIFNLKKDKNGNNLEQYLGSPNATVWYSVTLKKAIKKLNSQDSLFANSSGLSGDVGYNWRFAVGTVIDNTPPQIVSVVPRARLLVDGKVPGSEPRNIVVQINFSEAIDPTSASGKTVENAFRNIQVMDNTNSASPVLINGIFYISNQYRTVEFLTLDACGVNSCGNTVYCLPADKPIKVLAKAATLQAAGAPGAFFTNSGYDGIVDMAGNSLDGNGNGQAQGPQAPATLGFGSSQPPYEANNPTPLTTGDDYVWTFNTNSQIDTTPPEVNSVSPILNRPDAGLRDIPHAVFSKLLLSQSLDKLSIGLKKNDNSESGYWVYKSDTYNESEATTGNTTVYVGHNIFDSSTKYAIQFNSGIKDIYQNCYFPCSGLGVSNVTRSCCQNASGVMVPVAGSSCP